MIFTKKPFERFEADFKRNRDDAEEYTFHSRYIASNAPITVKHEVCGTLFDSTPSELTRKSYPKRCPVCHEVRKPLTFQQMEYEIKTLGKDAFTLLKDDFEKTRTRHLTIRHDVCGTVFKAYRHNLFYTGMHCPRCDTTDKKKGPRIRSTEEVRAQITRDSGGKYTLISDYQGNKADIVIRNNETGVEHTSPYFLFRRELTKEFPRRKSNQKRKRSQTEVEAFIQTESKGRFELKSKYKGVREPVTVLDTLTGETDTIQYASLIARLRKLNRN